MNLDRQGRCRLGQRLRTALPPVLSGFSRHPDSAGTGPFRSQHSATPGPSPGLRRRHPPRHSAARAGARAFAHAEPCPPGQAGRQPQRRDPDTAISVASSCASSGRPRAPASSRSVRGWQAGWPSERMSGSARCRPGPATASPRNRHHPSTAPQQLAPVRAS